MFERKGLIFRLEPDAHQGLLLSKMAGSSRFVYNKALALQKERREAGEKLLGYSALCKELLAWKADPATSWLCEPVAQALQQSLMDLSGAFKNMFEDIAKAKKGLLKVSDVREPHFKKKHRNESFRLPQGFRFQGFLVFLPKLGWMKFRKSRAIMGTPKSITIKRQAGHWFMSVLVEREVAEAVQHPNAGSTIGIDLGVARFATFSDGTYVEPLNSFRGLEAKLARAQRHLSRKTEFSSNWKKQKAKITRFHARIADARKDFLHKLTTELAKNHGRIVLEDLRVKYMSASAAGTVEAPGKNVTAKSGLNKAILDQGWGLFKTMLEYKLRALGGELVLADPRYTSQTCPECGLIEKSNRETQAKFKCIGCGHEANADFVAARNILAAGLVASACGGVALAAPVKQEETRKTACSICSSTRESPSLGRGGSQVRDHQLGVAVNSCGLCQTGVPCEAGIPVREWRERMRAGG